MLSCYKDPQRYQNHNDAQKNRHYHYGFEQWRVKFHFFLQTSQISCADKRRLDLLVMFQAVYTSRTHPQSQAVDVEMLLAGCRPL